MLWPLFYVYLGISCAAVFGLAIFLYLVCPAINDSVRQFRARSSTAQFAVYAVLVLLLGIILAPLLFPIIVAVLVRSWRHCAGQFKEQQETAQHLLRTHRELLMEPIHDCNLSDSVLAYFEQHSPSMQEIGFRCLGNYKLKDEPGLIKGRLFLDSGGTTFAEILEVYQCFNFELISYLEDGTVIDTFGGNGLEMHGDLAHLNSHGSFLIQNFPYDDLLTMTEKHWAFVEMKSAELQTPVCQIAVDQWEAYFHYHNRLFSQKMFELGYKDAPPESVIFPHQPMATVG